MDDFLNDFCLSKENIQRVASLLCQQLSKGLAKDTHDSANVKCLLTYVQSLPTGQEAGKALAIDFGGENFRILLVTLQGNQQNPVIDSKMYSLTKEKMTGPGTKLFDYFAECLENFLKERNLLGAALPLGFSLSFPCVNQGLRSALLIAWNKGFDCAGVVNEDVGRLLREAIIRRPGLKLDVVAVLNETLGTLVSCAHKNQACRVGLIIGPGCNASYVERSARAELLEDEYKTANKRIIINTEWGALGENGTLEVIRTEYDREVDRESSNKGQQLFEKMVSGMYLGELCRLAMLKAIKLNILFPQSSVKQNIIAILSEKDIFQTNYIFDIEGDCPPDYKATRHVIKNLFNIEKAHDNDVRALRQICEALSVRSATLVGTCAAVLINRVNETQCIVGVDGFVYRLHPKYEKYMRTVMRRLVNPRISFDLMLSEDGPGRGAAIVALTAAEVQE